MAATALTVNQVLETGIVAATPAAVNTVDGNTFDNDGKNTWIEITNAHATNASTVTFVTPGTVRGSAIADVTRTVAALTTKRFGPFPVSFYGDNVLVTFAAGTVTAAVYKI